MSAGNSGAAARARSPGRVAAYLILWFSGALLLTGSFVVYSLFWNRYITVNGVYFRDAVTQKLAPAGRIGYQAFSDEQLKYWSLRISLTPNVTTPIPPPATYDLAARPITSFIYFFIFMPIAWVGLLAILLSTFPSAAILAPQVHGARRTIRRVLTQRAVLGMSIGEVLFIAWYLYVNIIYFVFVAKIRAAEYSTYKGGIKDSFNFSERQYHAEWIGKLISLIFVVQAPFLMLSVGRGSLLTTFLGIKYSVGIRWHRFIGYFSFATLLLHGLFYNALWINAGIFISHGFEWYYSVRGMSHSNLAGQLSLLALIVLVVTALPWYRRKVFQVFYYSHVISAVMFVVFGILHYNVFFEYLYPSLAIVGVDVAYRFIQSSYTVDVIADVNDDGSIITMSIPIEEDVDIHDGAEVWICVPSLRRLEYHPFTVVSTSALTAEDGFMVVCCKTYSKWTRRLAEKAKETRILPAHVHGPFQGEDVCLEELERYSRLVFLTGGVGITGVLAMLKRLGAMKGAPRVDVVYVTRQAAQLHLLSSLLPLVHDKDFKLHIFYTGSDGLVAEKPLGLPALKNESVEPQASAELGDASGPVTGDRSDTGLVEGGLRRLPPTHTSRWELAAVWAITCVGCFFFMVIGDAFGNDTAAQLKVGPKPNFLIRAAMKMFYAAVACLVVPVMIAAPWGQIVQVRKGFKSTTPDSEKPPVMPPVVIEKSSVSGGFELKFLDTLSQRVSIQMDRPDIPQLLEGITKDVKASGKVLGVWVAGPLAMNESCAIATSNLRIPVEVHQRTHQL